MKKIVFGITNMNIGGAEKTLVDLLNNLIDDYDITLFTIYSNGILLKDLSKKIKVISILNKKYEDLNIIKKKILGISFFFKPYLIYTYNKYIKNRFDTEVSFLEGPITNLFSIKSNSKKIAWVHTDLSKHYKKDIWKYKKYYNNYDRIVFVSNESKKGFESIINNTIPKEVIHNYIDEKRVIEQSKTFIPKEINKKEISILSVSRLVEAKALDRLILVSKKLLENGYNHKIYIIGEGPKRVELEQLIDSFNMKDNFVLLGEKNNPYPYIKECKIFLIPSIYEGYPTVAKEAMILNKRIVSTNTGAKEALKNYDNKVIVDNSLDGLYKGIKQEIITHKEKKISLRTYKDSKDTLIKIKDIL